MIGDARDTPPLARSAPTASPRDEERERWLSQALDGRTARVEAASGDASFRRYFRVHLAHDTYILMDAPPPQEDCRPFVQVTHLLAAAGITVPRVIAADLDRGFLLLSDLGDRLYLGALDARTANILYGDALAALVRLQRRGDAGAVPAYDAGKLRTEMQLFIDWFLERHLGLQPDAGMHATLAGTFDLLQAECLAQPQVLVHRDYHSRNLMWLERGNPGVLDYQDAVRGPITYDLVSLLRDVYVRWPESDVYRWVDEWRARAGAAGLLDGVDAHEVPRWFDLTGVQRHLKVAGIFARLWYRDGKRRYLADIPLTLRYLREVAGRHRELAGLSDLLADCDIEGRNQAATAALDMAAPGP